MLKFDNSFVIKISKDKDFDFYLNKSKFNQFRDKLGVDYQFEFLLQNSNFFSIYTDGLWIGAVYVYYDVDEEKLFLNGYGERKNHLIFINVLKKISSFYNENVYALTDKKTASITLTHAGFEFVKEKKINGKKYKIYANLKGEKNGKRTTENP